MTFRRIASIAALLTTLCLLNACASFRAGTLPPPADWPPEAKADKQSISLIVTGESTINEKPVDVPPVMIQKWQEQIARAYVDSGLFSEVKTGPADTDLRAEVHVVDRGEGSHGMAIVTGLTLYIVPSSASDELIVRTKIKDREGQTLGSFEKSETVTFWQQLFLLFVMPFNWPASVAADTFYDINRAVIVEAREGGVI